MICLLVGSPGSGKTTIATHLASECRIQHISYRKIVHEYMANKRANSDEKQKWLEIEPFDSRLAIKILKNYLEKEKGDFVLEGFPKSANEANLLSNYLRDKLLNEGDITTFVVDTPRETAVERLNNRIVCP